MGNTSENGSHPKGLFIIYGRGLEGLGFGDGGVLSFGTKIYFIEKNFGSK